MKTNKKIEIGLLAFISILGIIFFTYVRSNMFIGTDEIAELTGDVQTKIENIEAFSRLNLTTDLPVVYREGSPKVEIQTDESVMDKINVEIKNNQLSISNNRQNLSDNLRRSSRITVYNNQALEYIRLERNVSMDGADTIRTEQIQIECDGNASARLLLAATETEIDIHGNSNINLKGSSNNTEIFSDGNARFYLKEFVTQQLSLRSSANSGGEAYSEKEVQAQTSGNSNVRLFGNPEKSNINSRSNSSINTHFGE